MTYQIVENATLAKPRRANGGGGRTTKYPFAMLEVNQAFGTDLTPDSEKFTKARNNLRQSATRFSKHSGMKFRVGVLQDTGTLGVLRTE